MQHQRIVLTEKKKKRSGINVDIKTDIKVRDLERRDAFFFDNTQRNSKLSAHHGSVCTRTTRRPQRTIDQQKYTARVKHTCDLSGKISKHEWRGGERCDSIDTHENKRTEKRATSNDRNKRATTRVKIVSLTHESRAISQKECRSVFYPTWLSPFRNRFGSV